jgi:hypothetical protein
MRKDVIMANAMLSTLVHTLAELKDSSHIHQRSVGDTEASEGSRERHPAKMEPIGPHVFLWAGLDQGSLRNHSGGVWDRKIEEKQAILRIYGF